MGESTTETPFTNQNINQNAPSFPRKPNPFSENWVPNQKVSSLRGNDGAKIVDINPPEIRALQGFGFLFYQEVHYIQNGLKTGDILAADDPVLAIDHHAWCALDPEKENVTLALT